MFCTMQPAGTMNSAGENTAASADATSGTASAIITCPPPLHWLCGK
ncbi:hypothetical protein [Bifidobacterium sp.]